MSDTDDARPDYLWVLEGPGLGDVAMEDVATFLAGIVKVVELACGHAVGRQVKQTGRRRRAGRTPPSRPPSSGS